MILQPVCRVLYFEGKLKLLKAAREGIHITASHTMDTDCVIHATIQTQNMY